MADAAGLELLDRRTLHTQSGYPAISGYRATSGPDWSLRLSDGRACRSRLIGRR